jgi:sporulation protein YlmC with PRC-barrel domain
MKFFLKKKLVIASLVPAFGLPFAMSSVAQTSGSENAKTGQSQQQMQGQKGAQQQQGQQGKQAQQAKKIRDMRASKLVGANVKSPKGEDLGSVQDLIVNADDGKVNYAIIAFGGTLGFGEKLFAYPMDRIQPATTGSDLVLKASKQEMEKAPGFDRSTWPTWGSGGYRGEVEKHFGKTAKAGGNLVRMSEIVDKKVADRAGNDVGKIEDVVVSVTDGKVRYVALDPSSDLNIGDRLVVLPMDAIRATGKKQFEQQAQQGQSGQSQQQAQQGQSGQPSQQAQQSQPGQPSQQAQQSQPGQPSQQAQMSRSERQQQSQQGSQQQAQQQQKEQDLQLVLTVAPKQLQSARKFEQNQWPDVNNPAFQREMDSYVASFPSGAKSGSTASGGTAKGQTKAGTTSGAGGTQGQTGSSATGPSMQQDKPAGAAPAQDDSQPAQQRSSKTGG